MFRYYLCCYCLIRVLQRGIRGSRGSVNVLCYLLRVAVIMKWIPRIISACWVNAESAYHADLSMCYVQQWNEFRGLFARVIPRIISACWVPWFFPRFPRNNVFLVLYNVSNILSAYFSDEFWLITRLLNHIHKVFKVIFTQDHSAFYTFWPEHKFSAYGSCVHIYLHFHV